VEARNFSLLQNVHTGSGAYPACYSVGSGVLLSGEKRDLYTELHLDKNVWSYNFTTPRYTLMVWTGKTLSFTLIICKYPACQLVLRVLYT